ncbi:hypothetical protein NERG_00572 [Nematocida ausubeli]|uniref:Uncharacterized protein n=1 Tax=Nematocida ausubeli (strain ATCC PRA-371 / ERTm2) TaxID=1913371 RepID=H8ZAF1_NEMA1|nr:hypothetical protein NERG_00572 [Nematocida ausubeli]
MLREVKPARIQAQIVEYISRKEFRRYHAGRACVMRIALFFVEISLYNGCRDEKICAVKDRMVFVCAWI